MSPHIVKHHCNFWISFSTISVILVSLIGVFFFTNVLHNHRWYVDLGIGIGSLLISLWCAWIVLVLRNMAVWWVNINNQINHAVEQLQDACQDIKEIKRDMK